MLGKTEAEKEQIKREYAIRELEIKNDIEAKKLELSKEYQQQQSEDEKLRRAIEFEQTLLELEERNASRFEFEQAQLEEQRLLELEKLEEDRLNNLISLENYEANKRLIEAQYQQQSLAIEQAKQQAIVAGYGSTLADISKLMGENTALGKTFAIAAATRTGYEAVMSAYATAQKSPITILNPAYPFIQAGIAGAFAVAQVAKIASTPTGKKAAKGMLITGPSHANGGVPISTPGGMIEAEGGEPILTKKAFQMYPDLISAINVAGGGIPLYAAGGLTPSRTPTVQNSLRITNSAVTLSDEAIQAVANAIYAGSQSGITDLSENRKIAQNA